MSASESHDLYLNHPDEWRLAVEIEDRFRQMSAVKHGAWMDAGRPLNAGGRAPRGMWREDSWANGTRLFAKSINGRRMSVHEWAERITSLHRDTENGRAHV